MLSTIGKTKGTKPCFRKLRPKERCTDSGWWALQKSLRKITRKGKHIDYNRTTYLSLKIMGLGTTSEEFVFRRDGLIN